MTDDRLPTHIWTGGLIRRCQEAAMPAMVIVKGDMNGGTVLLWIDRLDGTGLLLGQRTDLDGNRQWMAMGAGGPMAEDEQRNYIDKARRMDRDLWVIAIECKSGWPPLDDPLDPALGPGT